MTWTYDNSLRDDAEFLRQFIVFLQSCCTQASGSAESIRPEFVPEIVQVPKQIHSELRGVFPGVIKTGVNFVSSNQWGAISAKDSTGRQMGIRPHECVVLAMCRNPHFERNREG